jgi:hypothetical protein
VASAQLYPETRRLECHQRFRSICHPKYRWQVHGLVNTGKGRVVAAHSHRGRLEPQKASVRYMADHFSPKPACLWRFVRHQNASGFVDRGLHCLAIPWNDGPKVDHFTRNTVLCLQSVCRLQGNPNLHGAHASVRN